jgi:subtilisin family serine protease
LVSEASAAVVPTCRVAIIDSGWNRRLTDAHVLQGFNAITGSPTAAVLSVDPDDDHDRIGHGTHIAMIIRRIAPASTILPVRVFDRTLEGSVADVETAILWAVEQSVHFINLSLVVEPTADVRRLYIACERARRAHVVVVAAAGSEGLPDAPQVPAAFANVIGVSGGARVWPNSFAYHPRRAIECIAGVPRRLLAADGSSPASYATATMTGILARSFGTAPFTGLAAARRRLQALSRAERFERRHDLAARGASANKGVGRETERQ